MGAERNIIPGSRSFGTKSNRKSRWIHEGSTPKVGQSVVMRDDRDVMANLVVGSYTGHTVYDILLDTRMGRVVFVDA